MTQTGPPSRFHRSTLRTHMAHSSDNPVALLIQNGGTHNLMERHGPDSGFVVSSMKASVKRSPSGGVREPSSKLENRLRVSPREGRKCKTRVFLKGTNVHLLATNNF